MKPDDEGLLSPELAAGVSRVEGVKQLEIPGGQLDDTMMASGGYPWTIIAVGDRNAYVNALKKASVGEDIVPFADLLAGLVKKGLAGESLPKVPKSS